MAKTLKMVFGLANGEKITYSLPDPKNNLSRATVDDVMNDMIDKEAIVSGGFFAASISDAYIYETNRIELN